MTQLPIYQEREPHHGLALQRQRELLHRASKDRPQRLEAALEALSWQCVTETLRLTGVPLRLEEVIRVGKGNERIEVENRELILGQLRALDSIRHAARAHPSFDRSLLCEVHRFSTPPDGGRFRSRAAKPQFGTASPSRPEFISEQVDELIAWLTADSVRGLYPAERAALTFARLVEISPFEKGNFRVAHLLMNFFAFSDDYPPFFLRSEDAEEVREEIAKAMRFDTASLVARLRHALASSLEYCFTFLDSD